MKKITKYFSTMKDAERYQNRLYGRYHRVHLTSAPRFSEAGNYVWEVEKGERDEVRGDSSDSGRD